MGPNQVDEHTITLDQVPVFYRSAGTAEDAALYLHGAPTSSEDWVQALERTGGLAPDLIGFGRSGKAAHLEYTPQALAGFVGRFLDELGVDRVTLVAHDWGAAVGLLFAAGAPERVRQLVLFNPVPLMGSYRWHRLGRIWRTPVIGELAMGATTRGAFRRALRRGSVRSEAWPDERIGSAWEQFDQGTQRATLRLHRWASEAHLAEAEALLATLQAPALILWGERDPWFGAELADAYAQRLSRAEVGRLADAGHWPWLDDPSVIERVAALLGR